MRQYTVRSPLTLQCAAARRATRALRTGQSSDRGAKKRSSSKRRFVATLTSPSKAQSRRYLRNATLQTTHAVRIVRRAHHAAHSSSAATGMARRRAQLPDNAHAQAALRRKPERGPPSGLNSPSCAWLSGSVSSRCARARAATGMPTPQRAQSQLCRRCMRSGLRPERKRRARRYAELRDKGRKGLRCCKCTAAASRSCCVGTTEQTCPLFRSVHDAVAARSPSAAAAASSAVAPMSGMTTK